MEHIQKLKYCLTISLQIYHYYLLKYCFPVFDTACILFKYFCSDASFCSHSVIDSLLLRLHYLFSSFLSVRKYLYSMHFFFISCTFQVDQIINSLLCHCHLKCFLPCVQDLLIKYFMFYFFLQMMRC